MKDKAYKRNERLKKIINVNKMIRTAQYSHAEYETISVFFEKTNFQDYTIVFDKVKTIFYKIHV